jgi:hypothetical protein
MGKSTILMVIFNSKLLVEPEGRGKGFIMIHFGPADWWQPCGSHEAATSLGITIPLLCLKANIKPARVNPILGLAGIPFSYRISGAAIFTKLSPIKSQYSKRFVDEVT